MNAEHSAAARAYRQSIPERACAYAARWQQIWDQVTALGVTPASRRGTPVQLTLAEWEQLLSPETLVPPEARTAQQEPAGEPL